MAKTWDELPDGTLKLTVSPDEGGSASVFYGKTTDEILDKLIDSQANANRRLDQLRATPSNGNGHHGHAAPPPTANDPRPLTPNDRMQVVADLANPANVDKAVTRVVESVIGPIDEIRQDRQAQRQTRIEEAAVRAAEEFSATTPDFYLSDYNCNTLFRYLEKMQYDPTEVSSYQRGFRELSAAQLLQRKPTQASPPPDESSTEPQEPNAPNLRAPRTPARYSTGVRQSDISGTPPVPVKRLKWSREQIANMSSAEMRRLVTDPEFNYCVEYYARNPKKRTAAV